MISKDNENMLKLLYLSRAILYSGSVLKPLFVYVSTDGLYKIHNKFVIYKSSYLDIKDSLSNPEFDLGNMVLEYIEDFLKEIELIIDVR